MLILGMWFAIMPIIYGQENPQIKEMLQKRYPGALVGIIGKDYGEVYYIIYDYGKSTVKEGACDLRGKEIIAPNKYTSIYKLDGYFSVNIGDKEGACDLSGKEVVPCNFASVVYSSDKYRVKHSKDGEWVDYSPQTAPTSPPTPTPSTSPPPPVVTQPPAASGSKLLTNQQRERCKTDIAYLSQLANSGYPEAEYLLAAEIFTDGMGGDYKYQDYWNTFDPNNNYVAAAFWYKKACDHGWAYAYKIYAQFCFFERGGAKGGIEEAKKWTKKALTAFPNEWEVMANLGFYYLIDNSTENDVAGRELITKATKQEDAEQGLFTFLGTCYYYGIGFSQNKKMAFSYFEKSLTAKRYDSEIFGEDLTDYWFVIYCSYNGIGCEKNLFLTSKLLGQIRIGGKEATMDDANNKISGYDKSYIGKKLKDTFFPF